MIMGRQSEALNCYKPRGLQANETFNHVFSRNVLVLQDESLGWYVETPP